MALDSQDPRYSGGFRRPVTVICAQCGKLVFGFRKKLYCSSACRQAAQRDAERRRSPPSE